MSLSDGAVQRMRLAPSLRGKFASVNFRFRRTTAPGKSSETFPQAAGYCLQLELAFRKFNNLKSL
jgi:hypothetical protein